VAGVANDFGYGPFTVFPLSHHNEPFMLGDRMCSRGAYTFQIPGALAVQDNLAIPMKVQDPASVRCIYAYLQQGTSDGQSTFVVLNKATGDRKRAGCVRLATRNLTFFHATARPR